jgi:Tol biopolymer transport system component
VWTPDGRYLLFPKVKDEAVELWRISVAGGEPQNLGLTPRKMGGLNVSPMGGLSIHPDGLRIAFTGAESKHGAEIWAIENFLPGSTASR